MDSRAAWPPCCLVVLTFWRTAYLVVSMWRLGRLGHGIDATRAAYLLAAHYALLAILLATLLAAGCLPLAACLSLLATRFRCSFLTRCPPPVPPRWGPASMPTRRLAWTEID